MALNKGGKPSDSKHGASGDGRKSASLALAFMAIGVVYGDIGTSPLYAFKQSFGAHYGLGVSAGNVLGILSLIFWSLIIVVSIKYLSFVLRADNRGEGGMLALMALVVPHLQNRKMVPVVTILALFGAALLYGDGMITPAISVISAMEGLHEVSPRFDQLVIPASIAILIALFIMQSRGTRTIGRIFAPVMVTWFLTIAFLGVMQIVREPEVLKALWPGEAFSFFVRNRAKGFFVLGSVFLAITGAEALYADMGHFGRRPIRLAWFAVVLPSLVLNYFGQGALLLGDPSAVAQPFFRMAPQWALIPLVILSTAATVIASQAVISGAFSLTWQAVQMGFLPRVHIAHTSGEERGQVYIGVVNWVLMVACIALVLRFRTSEHLGVIYGVAVTTDMVFTTLLITACARTRWEWSLPLSLAVGAGLLAVDLPFWLSNLTKVPQGGYVPLAIALGIFMPMLAWKKGRELLAAIIDRRILPVEDAIAMIAQSKATRVPGIAVFMSRDMRDTPPTLLHNLKHNKVVHEHVVLLTVRTSEKPTVPARERLTSSDLGSGFHRVVLEYGFTDQVDVPSSLKYCLLDRKPLDLAQTTYFLGRETLIVRGNTPFFAGIWKHVFVMLSRNAESAMTFFRLPPRRVVELGAQIEI
jgi:KUP system potassium uptake protein